MHSRFADPDARFVIDLLIRIGEVGSLDIEGSLRKIGGRIGELLGHAPDPTRLYRGMRALAGQTSLVERVSRQIWRLCMAGITDPSSPRHQRLLEETPTPCRLEIVERRDAGTTARAVGPPARTEADPGREIDTTTAEVAELRAQVKQLGDERDACRADVEHLKSERRQLEEQLLEREIMIEAIERQLAELRDRPTVPVDVDKTPALKATLKAERERRRATETHLRRLLSALRIKLEGEPEQGLDLDRILWDSLSATLDEHLAALEEETEEAEREPGPAQELQEDIELTRALTRRIRRAR
jgi:predicted  nucleic acid-binding Zn-ribbon protein